MSTKVTMKTMHNNNQQQLDTIFEGNERGDLTRLVNPRLHIDEFRSKMGQDRDVCVLSFKLRGKEPALDLTAFVERGYNWVIDADVSSGEMDDGDYLVFVEVERTKELPENIVSLISDLMNLTGQAIEEWTFRYHRVAGDFAVTQEEISKIVPLTAEDYDRRFGDKEIKDLKTAAGLSVESRAPKNAYTESLRIAAGIR